MGGVGLFSKSSPPQVDERIAYASLGLRGGQRMAVFMEGYGQSSAIQGRVSTYVHVRSLVVSTGASGRKRGALGHGLMVALLAPVECEEPKTASGYSLIPIPHSLSSSDVMDFLLFLSVNFLFSLIR